MEVTVYASDVRDLHDEIMQRLNVRFEYGDEPFANSPAKKDEEHICAILRAEDVGTWHFEEGTMLDIMQGQQLQINKLHERNRGLEKEVNRIKDIIRKTSIVTNNINHSLFIEGDK
jgi:hypothetical protein